MGKIYGASETMPVIDGTVATEFGISAGFTIGAFSAGRAAIDALRRGEFLKGPGLGVLALGCAAMSALIADKGVYCMNTNLDHNRTVEQTCGPQH